MEKIYSLPLKAIGIVLGIAIISILVVIPTFAKTTVSINHAKDLFSSNNKNSAVKILPKTNASKKGENTITVNNPSPTLGGTSSGNTENSSNPAPTSTTTIIQTPSAIPTISAPTPTPIPDNAPFAADWTNDGSTAVITSNKTIKTCVFMEIQGPASISGSGSISNNSCTIHWSNPGFSQGAKIESSYGESKTFGSWSSGSGTPITIN